jgi:hypothetical protein
MSKHSSPEPDSTYQDELFGSDGYLSAIQRRLEDENEYTVLMLPQKYPPRTNISQWSPEGMPA